MSPPETAVLEGRLEHITYHNEQTRYTVARVIVEKTNRPVTVVGYLPDAGQGQLYKFEGAWVNHPRYGEQFRIDRFEFSRPSTVEGIRKYLASGVIKGIGPFLAERLTEHFGSHTLDIISNEPEQLTRVEGIGEKKARQIAGFWKEHDIVRTLMQFMQDHGVKTVWCSRIYTLYKEDALKVLQTDPFRLAEDLPGEGFPIAEQLFAGSGIAPDDPRRVIAGVIHILEQFANEGHTFAPRSHIVKRLEHFYGIYQEATEDAIETLRRKRRVTVEKLPEQNPEEPNDQAVYLKSLHRAEQGLALRFAAFNSIPVDQTGPDPHRIREQVLRKLAIELSEEQLEVLKNIFSLRVAVITGGPGTGKTTLIRSITAVYEGMGKRVSLAAPTGRAARRLCEVTGKEAKTIHRMLSYNFADDIFQKNQDDPLDADAVIVDEASMIDTVLMYRLMNAVPVYSTLILVGDMFQLPSVGPGNVLKDMIASETVPVFFLKTIFRQAQKSPIVVNAHRVRRGEEPELAPFDPHHFKPEKEFYFLEEDDPETAASKIVHLAARTLPKQFGLDPVSHVQVLTPMHKGQAGTIRLNQMLQRVLNAEAAGTETPGGIFKPGDKVMHLKNNYVKEVFNGDIGIVLDIQPGRRTLTVDFTGKNVDYSFDETRELSLAYAVTVHKSQGSEYPAVVLPLITRHYVLLQRNLLYTAITRAKKLVILVGMKKALRIAINNDTPRQRLTGLLSKLKSNA